MAPGTRRKLLPCSFHCACKNSSSTRSSPMRRLTEAWSSTIPGKAGRPSGSGSKPILVWISSSNSTTRLCSFGACERLLKHEAVIWLLNRLHKPPLVVILDQFLCNRRRHTKPLPSLALLQESPVVHCWPCKQPAQHQSQTQCRRAATRQVSPCS